MEREWTEYDLNFSVDSTFDANGDATLVMGPFQYGERWAVTMYKSSAEDQCSLTMYKNYVSDGNFIDSSLNGGSDTGGIQLNLQAGEVIVFHYTLGAANAKVSASVFGKRYIPGRRGY